MHTMTLTGPNGEEVRIHYSSDWSGNAVIAMKPHELVTHELVTLEVEVPGWVLRAFFRAFFAREQAEVREKLEEVLAMLHGSAPSDATGEGGDIENWIVQLRGEIRTPRAEDGTGVARMERVLLRYTWDRLDVGRRAGFDRWANSTAWTGPLPADRAALAAIIEHVGSGS